MVSNSIKAQHSLDQNPVYPPTLPADLPADSPERDKTATERLIEFAATLKAGGARKEEDLGWRQRPVASTGATSLCS